MRTTYEDDAKRREGMNFPEVRQVPSVMDGVRSNEEKIVDKKKKKNKKRELQIIGDNESVHKHYRKEIFM